MKHLLIIVYILTSAPLIFGQWNYLNTGHLMSPIYNIQAVSENTVWALGENGTILKSTDGGETWVIQRPDIPATLNRMTFTSEMNGYITGNSGQLWRTTDGGITWSYQILHAGLNLTTVQFLTPQLGYISANTAEIMKTTDGGATWTHISIVAGTYRTMAFYNEQIGMIAYDLGKTARTTDGGATWLTALTGFSAYNDYVRDIQWLTAGKAYAVDANGHFLVTADTGRTWQLKTVAASFLPYSIHFIDSLTGYIADISAKTARTTDGGQTFTVSVSFAPGTIFAPEDIFVYDTSHVYIAGPKFFVYRTTNGGASWKGVITQQELQLNAITVYSQFDAYVAGSHGLIGECGLGSNNCYRGTVGTRKDLFAVAVNSNSRVIAVGEGGVVVIETQAFLRGWNISYTGFPENLFALAAYLGINNLFAAGEGGVILRSLDNGITWTKMNSGVTVRLNALKFFDPTTLIAVGDSGVVLRTTDSGVTWHQLQVNTTKKLLAVSGAATNRLITGEGGLVLRSSNNGDVWHRVVITDSSNVTGVAYGTQNSARLVTSSGIVYNSSNTGQSWSRELINPNVTFRNIDAYSYSAMGILYDKLGFLGYRNLVPVELTSFTATVSKESISLNWSTASETNNQGFEIQRSPDGETWMTIGFKPGTGTSTETNIYNFSDQVPLTGTNYYRLKQIDYDGTSEILQTVSAKFLILPDFSLEQNYPNPFNPATMISYSLPASGLVQLKIYNMTGEEVTSLVNELQEAGSYQISFNGSDLASGTYLYRITVSSEVGIYTQSRKMVLLK